jgi:hypothetical protein
VLCSCGFLSIALAQDLAHGVRHDLREVAAKAAKFRLKAIEAAIVPIETTLDSIQTTLDSIQTRPHRGEIVSIPTRLFEDIARDDLLALDLLFEGGDTPLKGLDVNHRSAT